MELSIELYISNFAAGATKPIIEEKSPKHPIQFSILLLYHEQKTLSIANTKFPTKQKTPIKEFFIRTQAKKF